MRAANLTLQVLGAMIVEMLCFAPSEKALAAMSEAELRDRIEGAQAQGRFDSCYSREYERRNARARAV